MTIPNGGFPPIICIREDKNKNKDKDKDKNKDKNKDKDKDKDKNNYNEIIKLKNNKDNKISLIKLMNQPNIPLPTDYDSVIDEIV